MYVGMLKLTRYVCMCVCMYILVRECEYIYMFEDSHTRMLCMPCMCECICTFDASSLCRTFGCRLLRGVDGEYRKLFSPKRRRFRLLALARGSVVLRAQIVAFEKFQEIVVQP